MQVSIITPLFNRLDLTRVFLDSLERTLRGWHCEVILVDDGSTDGTREFLATLRPPFYRVVLNERGLGFAANNNLAARLAQAPLLCLLNNDTVLRPRWLEPMTRLASLLPDVACVGNVQREPSSGLVDHYGVYFREDGVPLHAGKNASAAPTEPYLEWGAVTAACCVVRRDVFLGLGGFDEAYQNGLEDVDFCLRAGRRGFRHFVANRSVIFHHVSASPGRKTHEEANVTRFLGSWREFLDAEGRRRRTVAERREEGWRYLGKHRREPWRFDRWRVARAVEMVWSPDPSTRRLDALPRWWFAVQDTRRRRRKLERASAGGAASWPVAAGAPAVLLVVGETARSSARSGVPATVRALAGTFGRMEAYARSLGETEATEQAGGVEAGVRPDVRLVDWAAADRSLRLLPGELSVGLDAECLRGRSGEEGAAGESAPSLYAAASGTLDDPYNGRAALHELTAAEVPPPGSWVLLPEVLEGGQIERLIEYAHGQGWRVAVVLYELLATNEPQFFPPEAAHDHARYLHAVSRADVVLPVSEFTAKDWKIYRAAQGLPQGRVKVCRLGADGLARERTRARRRAREADEPVRILCVAPAEARKNQRTLLAAFERAVAERPELRMELCFVGEQRAGPGDAAAALHAAMRRHPGRVTWFEWVEASALRGLYEACDFTVYPSVLEGFGLPIVESLWFRKPCVCASFGAMDEAAYGGGCVTVEVLDAAALAEVIVTLAGDAERREALAEEIDRRWLRSWEECAREMVGLLGGG